MISIKNKARNFYDSLLHSYFFKGNPISNPAKKNSYCRMLNIYSTLYSNSTCVFDEKIYEQLADKTLDDLNDKFEQFLDKIDDKNCDITFNNGVLTLSLGSKGIYVINKQIPNRQIWLSSPISGPKRYDFIDGKWIYKRDGKCIKDLLENELGKLFNVKTFL